MKKEQDPLRGDIRADLASTRRQFMGGVGALVLGVSLLPLGIRAAQAAPKQGGSVRFAINDGAQTDSYDPATWQSSFTQVVFGGTLCNALTELDANGVAVPDLAESFAASADLKVWTFKLRPNLKFHDGAPVTANDVIESYRHHMGPKSSSAAKALVDAIVDVKGDGDGAVVFTLSGGNADFPYLVSDCHLVVMPAKAGGGLDWERGVATGPYIIEDSQPGIAVKMKRNPHYHKPGQPYFDAIEFVNIIDVAARTNALLTGEIDYMVDADIKTLTMLEQNADIEISKVSGLRHFSFSMNTTVAPFDNPDVRRALKYAVDREDIVKKAFLGNAKVANDNPIAPQIAFAVNPEPVHSYNIEKAKEYLAKAGLTSVAVNLSVAETAFPNAIDAALLFKEHAAKAGIEINVVREADDGYWDNVWQHKPFVGVDWLGKPTCDSLFTTAYAGGAPWNDTAWKNQRFDELLVLGRAEPDKAKRQEIYAEMQQILHDDGGAIVIAYALFIDAISKKIAHGPIGNMLQCDNFRMAERWWLA
ncbi:ABC transporter substrate-binding protein [Mesorhizobium sp.]|uniref:ABC transporter substrate-binding protein n=1 Tax=Mesorhizobium sp. TaxID=1871066 RepID=UPI000FE8133C|nr:ABC transporter substrate-binding protein [Mesorhizobium sp.]RWC50485.1 MAG: ABC transporter substrate-binding protein [Mesorhizobium sp.]RWC62384.1 MAG: ABC transporter substrate-binding protein [Mesorhizobium sp.]RWC65690.1 MAG: ABC transporter substrate-binding protein [Mesorhizobium sp.]